MDKKRHIILDGPIEEQDRRFKEWLGLRPDQSYDDLVITEEEEEYERNYRRNQASECLCDNTHITTNKNHK